MLLIEELYKGVKHLTELFPRVRRIDADVSGNAGLQLWRNDCFVSIPSDLQVARGSKRAAGANSFNAFHFKGAAIWLRWQLFALENRLSWK